MVQNNMIGQRFGRLTVVSLDKIDAKSQARWLCKCDCGKTVSVRQSHLRSGKTKSCGCLQRDRMKEFNAQRRKKEKEPDKPRLCSICGEPMEVGQQKYCRKCGKEHRKEAQKAEYVVYHRNCAFCGKEYETTVIDSRYCSPGCKNANKENDENRPYTEDTGMLIRKWCKEYMEAGMIKEAAVWKIACILGRSMENVLLAFKEDENAEL